MTPLRAPSAPREIIYPDSDGQPMSDNSIQFRWIVTLYNNLTALFHADEKVLVGGNMLWYAREGDPTERIGPDVFVVFGRPKGDRGSYKQWQEDGIPMSVVFEILSPENTPTEMADKFAFYDEHGVQEYYIFDPDSNRLFVYVQGLGALRLHRNVQDWVSPLLNVRFQLSKDGMLVSYPDGQPFLTFEQVNARILQEAQRRSEAERETRAAREDAKQARQLLARVRELSRKARLGQATPEELLELERLEDQDGGQAP